MMKKLLLTVTAVTALAAGAPVAAQYSTQSNVNANTSVGIDNRIARLEARIQSGIQAGTIDRREAQSLRQQLRDIRRLDRQYSRDGLSGQERADLQQRVRMFRDELRLADGRGNGYGYGQQNAYGQGGPYEEVECESYRSSSAGRGGLGGLFDSIFGGGNSGNSDDCGGLGIGQRVTGNLGAVPYQYRNQYRDGGGVYYRSDGRSIYQIDARTNTVVRVYGMNR